ncbi:MAG: NUDIX domain-containing protein [Eubacteriales bacterium]|nr:NUDIX domain-containing protein [Eubacteriales bacterium]
MIPYCAQCQQPRFPMFNVAMSAIVYDPSGTKVALIQQYGSGAYRLVAGYTNIGEDIEDTLRREIKEEIGLDVTDYRFNRSRYYEPTNTLMMNFACKVNAKDLSHINEEIDSIQWFTPQEAEQTLTRSVSESRLAREFVLHWFKNNGYVWKA